MHTAIRNTLFLYATLFSCSSSIVAMEKRQLAIQNGSKSTVKISYRTPLGKDELRQEHVGPSQTTQITLSKPSTISVIFPQKNLLIPYVVQQNCQAIMIKSNNTITEVNLD